MAFVIAISIAFSIVLYQVSVTAVQRGLRAPGPNSPYSMMRNGDFDAFRELRYQEQKSEILSSIIFLNISIIIAGGLVSYYLAKRTLEPIQEAMDRQARFTADAAHELRTPLSVMRAENEIALRDKELTKSSAVESIESNLEEVIRLQALTDTLLALSSNTQPDTLSELHVKDSLENVLDRMRIAIDQKELKVTNDVKDEVVVGNPDNIEQILTILIDNAIKYSEPKKSIEVTSKKTKNTVIISIKDHGIGIKKEDLPYIFDRFYRGETARTRSAINGHGLGLSLAKQLADNNGASIEYTPTSKGGSTFSLKLKSPQTKESV